MCRRLPRRREPFREPDLVSALAPFFLPSRFASACLADCSSTLSFESAAPACTGRTVRNIGLRIGALGSCDMNETLVLLVLKVE